MDLTTVEYEKRGAIGYVTLNRPEKLNAMNERRLHGRPRVDYAGDCPRSEDCLGNVG